KLIIEMRQPHKTIMTGVRQPIDAMRGVEGDRIAMPRTASGIPERTSETRGADARTRSLQPRSIASTLMGLHPAGLFTSPFPTPQTKLRASAICQRMAARRGGTGNSRSRVLYPDLLGLRISRFEQPSLPALGRMFSSLLMLVLSIFHGEPSCRSC